MDLTCHEKINDSAWAYCGRSCRLLNLITKVPQVTTPMLSERGPGLYLGVRWCPVTPKTCWINHCMHASVSLGGQQLSHFNTSCFKQKTRGTDRVKARKPSPPKNRNQRISPLHWNGSSFGACYRDSIQASLTPGLRTTLTFCRY